MTKQNCVLSLNDVDMSYGKNKIVHGAQLEIMAGECFGLMGLNGAGKTTLIKAILGLRKQDCGVIKVFGNECTSSTSKAKLSYLPEKFEPAWFLTGLEFLKFSFDLYKQKFDEKRVVVEAEKVSMGADILKRRVNTYSKGMRQKLGLLGSILVDCPLLILDEPMSGLDPKARSLVKDMIVGEKKKGRTVFLSSHILSDMDEICDRVALLHDGEIQYVGTPKLLKKKTSCDHLERAFLQFIEKKQAA